MMYKYRIKTSVEVEAFQMTEKRRWDNSDWPSWLHIAWQGKKGQKGSLWCNKDSPEDLYLGVQNGTDAVYVDMYVVRDDTGQLYSYSAKDFEALYEKREEFPATTPDLTAAG